MLPWTEHDRAMILTLSLGKKPSLKRAEAACQSKEVNARDKILDNMYISQIMLLRISTKGPIMKKLSLLVLVFLVFLIANGYAQVNPDWQWVSYAEGSGVQRAISICSDGQGYQYAVGYFTGTTGFGDSSITSNGYADIYVAKLDMNGNWLWAASAGGNLDAVGRNVALDPDGNVYVAGEFEGSALFGDTELVSDGNIDAFIAKLDSEGNWLWAKAGGSQYDDSAYDLSIAITGEVCITGFMSGNASFGQYNVNQIGYKDIFLARLDSSGNWLGASVYGGTGNDEGRCIEHDDDGNIYVGGVFARELTLGGTTLDAIGGADAFIAKMDNAGNWQWAKGCGGDTNYQDVMADISVNPNSTIAITGLYFGTAVFGDITYESEGWEDIFVASLDYAGNWLWVSRARGAGMDSGIGVHIDNDGKTYVTGNFQGTISFDQHSVVCHGGWDIFTAATDAQGNWLWALGAGSDANDFSGSLSVYDEDNIYVHGTYSGTAWFGDTSISTTGGFDCFVAKLSTSGTAIQDVEVPAVPGDCISLQCSPNPVCRGSEIRFETKIPANTPGTIEIYNIRGQMVAQLNVTPETGTVQMSSAGLANGIYLCRLVSAGQSTVTRVSVIK